MRKVFGCFFILIGLAFQAFGMELKKNIVTSGATVKHIDGQKIVEVDGLVITVPDGFSPPQSDEEKSPRGAGQETESNHSDESKTKEIELQDTLTKALSDFGDQNKGGAPKPPVRTVPTISEVIVASKLAGKPQTSGRLSRILTPQSSDESESEFSETESDNEEISVDESLAGLGNDTIVDISALKKKIQEKDDNASLIRDLLVSAGVKKLDDDLVRRCSNSLNSDDRFLNHLKHLKGKKKKKSLPSFEKKLVSMLKDLAQEKCIEALQSETETTGQLYQQVISSYELLKQESDKKDKKYKKKSKVTKACTVGSVLAAGGFVLLNTTGSWGPFVWDVIKEVTGMGDGMGSMSNSTAIVNGTLL